MVFSFFTSVISFLGGEACAAIQKTVFSADVVASACHVVVDADSTGN
ncbi:fimbrial protein, partial [Escherichia coli]|nr:fimbrial protein [Escherichia coli]